MDPRRRILLAMLDAALERVAGEAAVRAALAERPLPGAPPALIAIGKAAESMLAGARAALRAGPGPAIVITPAPPGGTEPAAGTLVLHASHPLPDARSIAAGERLFAWIAALPAAQPVLLLISGGASSLVELPRAGVTLGAIRALNERALASGIDIATLNAERARLSRIKGGGLTAALAGRAGLALFISDVPGDDPAVIGSGLAGPAPGVPDRLERRIVANVEDAVRAASARARSFGLVVDMPAARFDGEAEAVARRCVARLRQGTADALAAGGETVVRLPPAPGRGGRNQQLALAAAIALRGDPDLVLAAVGTDGIDGPTADAGGLVDGGTCGRIGDAGLDSDGALAAADAGTALEAAGDLVHTGPTGTNVGDLVLALRLSETRAADLLAAHGEPPAPML